jgi:hypothetical protein
MHTKKIEFFQLLRLTDGQQRDWIITAGDETRSESV